MNTHLSLTLYADVDGFITFNCPYCNSDFKLSAADVNDDDFPILELFCPYCGLASSPDEFLSKDAVEAIETIAHNYMAKVINKEFRKISRNVNSKKGIIHLRFNSIDEKPRKDVSEVDSTDAIFACQVCQREVKVSINTGLAKAFCPYCGVDL